MDASSQIDTVSCPGCGVVILSVDQTVDKELNASAACQKLFHELAYFTLGLGDTYFLHQLVVDTYGAQHFTTGYKPVAITFALVGLYLVNEKHVTGKYVQNVHVGLAKKNKAWPAFVPRTEKAAIIVHDVLQVPDSQKPEMIRRWCHAVWELWKDESEEIALLLKKYVDIE